MIQFGLQCLKNFYANIYELGNQNRLGFWDLAAFSYNWELADLLKWVIIQAHIAVSLGKCPLLDGVGVNYREALTCKENGGKAPILAEEKRHSQPPLHTLIYTNVHILGSCPAQAACEPSDSLEHFLYLCSIFICWLPNLPFTMQSYFFNFRVDEKPIISLKCW